MNILVADDNCIVLDTIGDLLQLEGHVPTKSPDGSGALALLRIRSFDLLITDIRMPGLNGLDLASAARESYGEEFPVILISGTDQHPGLEDALMHTMTRLVPKPIRIRELLEAINSLKTAMVYAEVD